MIRVLQVVTSMDIGGLEVLVMNLYRHIDRSQFQFDFLVHRDKEAFFDQEILALGGRIFHVPPVNPLHHRRYLDALSSFFSEHCRDYCIVHAHNNAFSMYVLRAAKRANIPVCIAHSHVANFKFSWKKTIFYNYCRHRIKEYCDYFFGCSTEAAKWLFGEEIVHNQNFRVIRNAISTADFRYDEGIRKSVRADLRVKDELLIGHIGRFTEVKNHDFVVKVFNECRKMRADAKLVLVGNGSLLSKVKEQLHLLGLEEKALLLGIRGDVPKLLQAMDVILFPSLYEGFGITLIEAQAAGLSCLASDRVPKEAKVTDLLEFIPLEEPPERWAQKALQMIKGTSRRDHSEEVKAAGYDIAETARWLQDFYLARHTEATGNKT